MTACTQASWSLQRGAVGEGSGGRHVFWRQWQILTGEYDTGLLPFNRCVLCVTLVKDKSYMSIVYYRELGCRLETPDCSLQTKGAGHVTLLLVHMQALTSSVRGHVQPKARQERYCKKRRQCSNQRLIHPSQTSVVC